MFINAVLAILWFYYTLVSKHFDRLPLCRHLGTSLYFTEINLLSFPDHFVALIRSIEDQKNAGPARLFLLPKKKRAPIAYSSPLTT